MTILGVVRESWGVDQGPQCPTFVCALCDSEKQEGSYFFKNAMGAMRHSRENPTHNLFKPIMVQEEFLAVEGEIEK